MAREGARDRGLFEVWHVQYVKGDGNSARTFKEKAGSKKRADSIVQKLEGAKEVKLTSEWWVRYHDTDGQERREKGGTKSQARALYQKRKAAALTGQKLPELNRRRASHTVTATIEKYMPELRTNKPRSIREDERHAKYWRDALGTVELADVRPTDIEKYKTDRLAKVKPATVNRSVAFLKMIFNKAIRDGLTVSNPVARVKKLLENNSRVRYLKPEEEVAVRKAVAAEIWLKIEFAILTGLRQGEQFGPRGLRWENVDFGAGTSGVLTIPRPKNGEVRHVPLSPRAREILETVKEAHPNSPWVFPGQRPGTPYAGTSACHVLARACERAKVVDFHWHDLRHTFCSRLVMKGVPLRTVQLLAGHKTITVTERYAHLAPGHLQEAVALLDSTLSVPEPVATGDPAEVS